MRHDFKYVLAYYSEIIGSDRCLGDIELDPNVSALRF